MRTLYMEGRKSQGSKNRGEEKSLGCTYLLSLGPIVKMELSVILPHTPEYGNLCNVYSIMGERGAPQ